uniref:G_PROTEIN_RECEP_F1_2 domain-containing protein n=1 Tax=Trichobilharzia regenti TaxID=157069 RepID=A0AA85JU43_TRIRE|nr:unnamed protein product [Trichobilharzia regenti]
MSRCEKENLFITTHFHEELNNHIFYTLNGPYTEAIVKFAAQLNGFNNTLQQFMFLGGDRFNEQTGIIASSLLERICGPYPSYLSPFADTFEDIVHSYILPVLMVFVIITNFFVCLVLSRPQMRSPVFLLLLIIGIVELTNSFLPLPMYSAQSLYRRTAWWTNLPINNFTVAENALKDTNWQLAPRMYYQTSDSILASEASAWSTVFLPTITHTISVWLTVTLALKRVIYLFIHDLALKLCTLTSTGMTFLVVTCFACVLHWPLLSSRFILFRPIQLRSSFHLRNSSRIHLNNYATEMQIPTRCLSDVLKYIPGIVMKCHLTQPFYMLLYFYTRIVLIHILPCGLLIILTIILLMKMRSIMKLRTRLGLIHKKYPSNTDRAKPVTFCCLSEPRRLSKDFTNQVGGSLTAKNVNNTESIQISGHKTSAVNPQAISRMLVVVLVKFIAMHLPNAFLLTIYVVKSMYKVDHAVQNSTNITRTTTEMASTELLTEVESGFFTPSLVHNYTVNASNYVEYASNSLESSSRTSNSLSENNDLFGNYLGKAVILCNLVILVSYQLNFFIYYAMSTQFKETFHSLCFGKLFKFCKI